MSCIIRSGFLIELLSTCVNLDVKSMNESVKQHPCTLVKQAWTNMTEKTNSGGNSDVNWSG